MLAVTLRPLGYSHHNNPPVSAAASEGASSSANVGAIAERMHRAISKRADPVPYRCSARRCTSRLPFVFYQGFGLAVIQRIPHLTHSSSSLGTVDRDAHELPQYPATMIFASSLFGSTGSAPTKITDSVQVRYACLRVYCIFYKNNAATHFRCTTTRL